MKRYWIILLLIPFLFLYSCVEDTSAYDPQQKEDVKVDEIQNEEDPGDEELPEGELVPGIHLVKLTVPQPDGSTAERQFKYFMPVSTDASKPISLIFEFHSSSDFKAGEAPAIPWQKLTSSNAFAQNAIKENCVVCYPIGSVEKKEDGSGATNWEKSEKHLPFIDAIIEYFKGCTPTIDANRIFATGHDAGAAFCFVLALERPEVFAAIVPRAGQISLENHTGMPSRIVPLRVFVGEKDKEDMGKYQTVMDNVTNWVEKIGGYFASDAVISMDSVEIEDYKKLDFRIWSGGSTDMQIITVKDEEHSISENYCMPYIWEFMAAHTLELANSLYINVSQKEIDVQCGEPLTIPISYTQGAYAELVNAPKGWNAQLTETELSLTGPKDFFANIDRNGELTIKVTKDGESATNTIAYKLQAPKNYFEVGDIYYNDDFEPVGVVCWVNPANIKEAKIINMEELPGDYENGKVGDFKDVIADSYDDGESNSTICVEYNQTNNLGLTASTSSIIWAAEYTYKDVSDWYLPAINEWKTIYKNRNIINKAMAEIKGRSIRTSGNYDTSTITAVGDERHYYYVNFKTGEENGSTKQSYNYARAVKKVTK